MFKRSEMILLLRSALLILLTFASLTVNATHYYYRQIAFDETVGLPSTIKCIFADRQGYLWIGTKSGLGRFDGNELRCMFHDDRDEFSLPGNNIYQVTEDADGDLWVVTDGGLSMYDYHTSDFYTLSVRATSACLWRDGLLLGGEGEVSYYNKVSGEVSSLCKFSDEDQNEILQLNIIDDATLLCRTRWGGLWTVDLNDNTVKRSIYKCGLETTGTLIDREGDIWVSEYGKGVYRFAKDGRLIAEYTKENGCLSNDVVICLTEHKGTIWAGTDGGGINIIDPISGTIQTMKHRAGERQYSLPTDAINCLYSDPSSNLWIGGVYSGLTSVSEVNMKAYTDLLSGQGRGVSNNIVLSIEPFKGYIFIGTDGGGVDRFDPVKETFFNYKMTADMNVVSICGLNDGKLLISAFGDGVYTLDTETGQVSLLTIVNDEINTWLCKHGNSVTVYRNSANTALVMGDHLYIYDILHNKFTAAKEERSGMIYNGTLRAIWHDDETTYLSDYKHIYEFDHSEQYLKLLFTCNDEMNINSAICSQEGFFWLGTNKGLMKYDPYKGTVERVESPIINEVTSLLIDREGKLWIGAYNQLVRYSPDDDTFAMLCESDGAMPNEYIPGAASTYDGEFFFGGVKGLLHISKGYKTQDVETPQLKLSDLIVNGESSGRQASTKEISLKMGSNVKIMFMAKEKDLFRKRLYRYRVKGIEDSFTETVSPEISLTGLRPGTYKVLVACTLRDGSWTETQQIAQIRILPPWYSSTWFIILCVLFIPFLIVVVINRSLKRQEIRLQIQSHEHERELNEKKVSFLINISHELRTPLTLIHAPLKRILNKLPQESETRQQLLRVYRQSQRMKDLINMVLDLRKMETGMAKLQFENVELNQWIRDVSADYAAECINRGIGFKYHLDESVGEISLDKSKCEIVLTNLLINAMKHSPAGTTITISTLLTGTGMVRISISDEGSGLKNADPVKIFTRFYQGDGERHGTGIGLSYSKILVEQHHGKIGAVNNNEHGATFFFELPIKQEGTAVDCKQGKYLTDIVDILEEDPVSVNLQPTETATYTLLFVDDSDEMTEFIKEAVKDNFKKVLTACNGEKALQLTLDYMPDIIVSDVMMPKMNGYELCQRVKTDLQISHIPVVLLTAKSDDESMKSGYKSGADAYLSKPFEIETLLQVIMNRLRDREMIRKKYMSTASMPIPEAVTISQADEAFLTRLNELINKNIDNTELDTTLLCKEMCMSRASLFNKMKALTGMGSSEYITRVRMEKAMTLIKTTDMNFTEISEQVGYTSSAYFSTSFKQFTGESPSKYKKKMKG